MTTDTIISADSHMVEPPDLWLERLDKKFRDRAPRVFFEKDKEAWFFGNSELPPFPCASLYAAGKTPEEYVEHQKAGFEAAREGGWDPAERIKDMEMDGVSGEVLYTSLGCTLFWLEDAALQEACFRVYNDWLAAFVSHAPERFAGLALISMWNVDNAVKELERSRKRGLKGAMVWSSPPAGRAFAAAEYDRFWSAAEDLAMPISLHIITGRRESALLADHSMTIYQRRMGLLAEIQRSLTDILFSGLLERFSRLKLVSAENDIGWIAYFLQRADKFYHRMRYTHPTELTMAPSEYFKRQVFATFMTDPVGTMILDHLGANNFLWSSDYPHQASTWPNSRDIIARDFANVPAETKQKIVHDNCATLYGFTV